ncbi:beta strand repeat-containing protein [Bartonella schoenbuchensis]|uniref:beta strand repeat-containing protein n=1 Tax=Bartonella schoenbuchensis TaxID=165694 RepID=UPI003145709A
MVMRRVFNRHVCLCVLSTAILAGLALMTSQTKVYAAQNCKGLAGSSEDKGEEPIVCDGTDKGSGWRNGVGELSGKRNIDMGVHSGAEAAVTVTGQKANIRISSKLTVKDSGGSNNNPAIKVHNKGVLMLVGDVSVEGVQKGIDVSGSGSSVTVVQGKIGVRKGGGPVIEVKNNGEVTLIKGVTVTESGSMTGEVVINNGGTVQLNGQSFTGVITGIKIMGNGNASVKGGATITVKQDGTGFKMQGQGTADVVDMTITGSGGKGTGVIMEGQGGTLTLNSVKLKQLETGAKVTNGVLKMEGSSTINVAAGGKGLEVLSGTANVTSTTITLQGDGGKGVKVNNGKVTMMGGSITGGGNGTGATGLEMEGSADVTLMGVTMREVGTGITMTGGTLTVNGGTKIQVVSGGTGLEVKGSGTVTMMSGEITAGGSGKGVVMKGNANVTLMGVTLEDVKTGVEMGGSGVLKLDGDSKITVQGNGTGMNVTGSGNVVMTGTLTITGSGTTGMSVSNGTVMMNGETTITVGHNGTGMSVTDGTVMMNGGLTIKASGMGTTGVVMSGGEVMMKQVDISGFAKGVEMSGGKRLTVEGGRIVGSGSRGVGISVTRGNGNVTVKEVNISEVERGIKMEGTGGTLTVEGGEIRGRGRGGVGIDAMGGSGNVMVKRVNISGFTTGVEVSGGKTLKLEGGTMIEVGHSGTGVKVGAGVTRTELTGVEITKSGGGGNRGVEVKGGTVKMERVNISGFATGVYMETGVTGASLTNVNISRAERGIYMDGSGTLTVSGTTTISFTENYGVYVGSSVAKAELTGVTITGNGGSESKGVWVKGGEVVMNTVGISGVTTGVLMEKGESLTVSGGSIGFEGTYGVMVGETVKKATLTNVTITGSGGNGVGVYAEGGNLTVKGTTKITGVKMGISMKGSGTLTVEEGTKIEFTGTYGVMVGSSVKNTSLIGVTIEGKGSGNGNGYGVLMTGSTGTLKMERVGISKVERGIAMSGNGTLIGVNISQVKKGVYLGSGTLTMNGGKIGFTGDYGVAIERGATATLTNVEIKGSGNSGTGIYAEGGVLMVSGGSIKGVEKGITMMGYGVLMVKKEAKINFTGEHGVYVGKRVKSTSLIGVTITGNKSGTGIYAEGGEVTVKGTTTITGVEEGIAMTEGKSLTVKDNTRIEFMGEYGYGVYVGGSVKKATLTGVTIEGKGSGNGNEKGTGVWVEGGNLTVSGGSITGVKAGIFAVGGGRLTVKDSTRIGFTGAYGYGVYVGKRVTRTELMGVTIAGNKSGTGIYAMGGEVTVKGTTTITGVEEGIAMTEGKSLTVKDNTRIEFTGNYGYGIYVGKSVKSTSLTGVTIEGKGSGVGIYARSGDLMVSGGSITEVKAGIFAVGGGSLTVKDSTRIEFTGNYGVMVEGGATAELKGTKIVGSGNNGMGVWAKGRTVMMEKVDISNVGMGVYAEGGVLMVSGGSITGVEEGIKMMGYGVLMVKEGTRIEFTGNYGYGIYVGDKVRATLTNVEITGSKSGTGVIWESTGNATLTSVNVSQVEMGVYATGGNLTVIGGEIKGVERGITMMVGKSLTVKDKTRIEFTGAYGVYVGDKVRAKLTDVEIKGSGSGYGVFMMGGEVMMERVNVSKVETGIYATGGAMWLKETHLRDVAKGMTIEEGVVRMEGGSVEFKGEYGISLTGGYADLRKVNMTYKSDGLNANFIKVERGKVLAEGITMTGNGKGQGVKVANGGAVWLKETTFTNVKSGMAISEGSVFMFKGGITFKGEYGIYLSNKGHALLSDFDITGPGGTSKTTATGIGVVVSSLGEIMMRDVNISGVATGAYVTGYGLLVMDKGSITFKGKHGINLVSGHAFLNGVKITGPGSGTGIELGYGQVLIKDTTFTNVDKAITVTQGDVRMEGGEIEFKGEHGILLGQGGVALMGVTMRYKGNSATADFIKITGEDTTNAVEAVDPKTKNTFTPKSAVVVAASLKIDGSGHGQALNVTNGGRVVLMNPTYTDVHTGMTITKGAVRMIEGSMEFTGGHGILLKQGHALLTNVTMRYTGHEQNTTFLKVEAENVLNTADIIGTGIKIDGKGYGQGVHVTKGGRVKLKNAVFSDVVKGVSVVNGEFWMKGGEITFKGDYGVSLSTGKVLLKRVIMKYKGGNRGAKAANTTSPNFIKVEGKGANLAAIKVMITGNEQGLGVKVANGGHVTLKQSHVPIQSTIHITHNLIL